MEIQQLSPEVIDQIAAGEVVERPAHLVKELVENSVDAGATEVEIEFNHGGRQIRVRDNGKGIANSELPLALARHATSKIKQTVDLWSLSSFGFRGEALASIAAVSKLKLVSKPSGSEAAYSVHSDFGKLSEVEVCGGEQGTTVWIDDLFSNIPARLKFLKSDAAESGQIKNVIRALAMAHPEVCFRVRHKGKLLFYWPECEAREQRVGQVLEQNKMYVGEGEADGVKAHVVISSPNNTVRTSRQIWLYAQNRWVQDRSLQAAVMDAYRSLLMHGEFPIAAVWVECDPEEIDVNIHPAKSQVKFRNSSLAFRAVARAVRGVLERAPWLEEVLGSSQVRASASAQSSATSEMELQMTAAAPVINERFQSTEMDRIQYSTKSFAGQSVKETLQTYAPTITSTISSSFEDTKPVDDSLPEKQSIPTSAASQSGHWSGLHVVGQAHLTYILAQSDKAMIIVDQHAAHERVVYERLMQAWKTGDVEVQQHLLPQSVELSEEQVEALMPVKAELSQLGLDIDQVGPNVVAVRAAPSLLKPKSVVSALELVATECLEKGESFAFEKVVSDLCATMACHSVVRAGQPLSHEEMVSLLAQMDDFPLSSFCPHGRPVYVEYAFSKLERDFGRIV